MNKKLDKWYTIPSTVDFCLNILEKYVRAETIFIEPSAGDGKFIDVLEKKFDNEIIAFDILPERNDIIQQDWFCNNLSYNENYLIVGNPPFGVKGKLAVDFINKSSSIANTIAFILPLTLQNSYIAQNKINKNFNLVESVEIPNNSFIFENKIKNIPCVFQIWQSNSDVNLRLSKPPTSHDDLEIHIYNKTEGAKKWLYWDWDLAVKRNTKNAKYTTIRSEVQDDYHWILIKGDLEKLKKIPWDELNRNKVTAGIGKSDVILAYMKINNEIN
jgi:hypothetical protein